MMKPNKSQFDGKVKQTFLQAITDVLTLVLGLAGLFYAYYEYDVTLVDYKICFGVLIIAGALFALIVKRKHKLFLAYAILYGGIALGFMFFLNNDFAEGATTKIRPRIVGRSPSSFNISKPSVSIDMDSYTKTVTIGEDQDRYIAGAANIVLTVDKGLLGFEIIIDKRLTDD